VRGAPLLFALLHADTSATRAEPNGAKPSKRKRGERSLLGTLK
jgi:hypothetical protein